MIKENIFPRVVQCISTSTRYPTELLTADADLENDLGIDSVKRLEIVVALEEEFGLPLSNQERDPSIRTIADITRWIEGFLAGGAPVHVAPVQPAAQPPVPHQSVPHQSVPHQSVPHGPVQHQNAPQPVAPQTNPVALTPQPNLQRRDFGAPNQMPQRSSPHFPQTPNPPENMGQVKSLRGRVALVTGSGRGVGRVIARVLASKGATVIVNSFHSRDAGEQTAAEIVAEGGSAIHLWGSITNSAHLDQIFSQIESQFGKLDILVCNASDGRIGSFMELTPDDWDRAFRTNVVGHHQCAMRASGLMQAAGGGSIVTMSAVGSNGWVHGLGSQGVVKAAVETLTRYLACELAKFGIRANCVAGGPVYGELLDKFPNSQAVQNQWEKNTPDGQLCSPLDLANAIAFLVGEDAKGINGSVWVVDHGFSAVAGGPPDRVNERERVAYAQR